MQIDRRGPIVVVDDHEDSAEMLAETLRANGCIVETYTDAREGLARLLRAPVLLAIVDYRLAGMTGLDLVRSARAARIDAPIACITAGVPTKEERSELRSLRVMHVLKKPLDVDELLRIVGAACAEGR